MSPELKGISKVYADKILAFKVPLYFQEINIDIKVLTFEHSCFALGKQSRASDVFLSRMCHLTKAKKIYLHTFLYFFVAFR